MILEVEDFYVWAPVLIGIGIIFSSYVTVVVLFVILVCCGFSKKSVATALLVLVGVVLINLRIYSINTQFIDRPQYIHNATAVIQEINYRTGAAQLILSNIQHYKLRKASKIRVKVHNLSESIKSGDKVLFSAKLHPPSRAVSPGAYDFAWFAYFNGISAVGFVTKPIQVLLKNDKTFFQYTDIVRNYVASSFVKLINSTNGNIAAALIVGKRQGIDKATMENIRKAGLAHLFAISGLHITIVTFFFFVMTRKLFALSVFISTKYNIKKWSAIIAMIAGSCYLVISGMALSAQRAYIMVLIALTAILIDRNTSSIRSVAFAASVLLVIEPESIFTPSFQMSFAAVIALCSFYTSYKTPPTDGNLFYKLWGYFVSILTSSLIASFATAPYTIYHFNYLSVGGIIANLVAIPLTTFIILPLGVVSTILMPINLSAIPSSLMSYAISLLVNLSAKIAALPYSSIAVHKLSDTSLFVITFGFLFLTLWQKKWRVIGVPIIVLGVLLGFANNTPDILMNEKMVAVRGGDKNLYFLTKQRRNFINKTWVAQNGQREIYLYTQHNSDDNGVSILCNVGYCTYKNKGKSILFLYAKPEQIETNNFDYVIQLKEFDIDERSNVIKFEQIRDGYFMWLNR